MSSLTWARTTITWPRCWPWTCTRSWGTGRLPVDLRWMMSFRPGLTTQVTAAPLGLQGGLLPLLPGSAPWQQAPHAARDGCAEEATICRALLLAAIWHSNSQAFLLCNCSAKYFKSELKKKKANAQMCSNFYATGGRKILWAVWAYPAVLSSSYSKVVLWCSVALLWKQGGTDAYMC